MPTDRLEAPSIKWLLETSTDPEAFLAAVSLVPQVEWPLDLDVSNMLHQLYDIFTSCVDIQDKIVPSLEEKASACTMALSHLYCGRVLQAYPDRGEFLGRAEFPGHGRSDYSMFLQMSLRSVCVADNTILSTTMNLCAPEDDVHGFSFCALDLEACPDSVPERLSHVLPYHFVTGRANQDIEKLAITVISRLLSSPSPSNQIITNCTLLAGVMVGVQFDKKDIIRIDKSSALLQLMESLLTQFQKVLWEYDGGDIDRDRDSTGVVGRAWNLLDVICRMLELYRYYPPSIHTMRNLGVCRKIYSQARSSKQNDPSVSLAALRKVLHFTFAAAYVSRDPAQLWSSWFFQGDSHSPEDFDWLVDYLDYIHSDDHETLYEILLLMGGMEVSCSPAKQHVFVERLIPCMDSNMPDHLCHAALRAVHSARKDMASIDAMDDALRDMVLTKLSPAILSVICPLPGATPTNDDDDPDRFFDHYRDSCYLELVFALAKNSNWHPYLYGDHHIDWCISIIAECCKPYPLKPVFYLAGILLRIASEQTSVTSLDSVTEQQWWDMMRSAWSCLYFATTNKHDLEFLPVLAEGTKRYMQIASKSDLEQLIGKVDHQLEKLEKEEMQLEMRDLAQGEGVVIAVKNLRTAASDMLEGFGQAPN